MSAPKRKVKSSVNRQVKAGLSAVRDFLAGRSGEAKLTDADDQAVREVVGAELLAAMSGRSVDENGEKAPGTDTQEIPRLPPEVAVAEVTSNEPQPEQSEISKEQEQERARKLFLDHGYFDEAVHNLRGATSPAERAHAARALGLFGSQRGRPHLFAAMFDDDPEVRSAAEEALAQIGDPATKGSADIQLTGETGPASDTSSAQSVMDYDGGRISSAAAEASTAPVSMMSVGLQSPVPQTGDAPAEASAGGSTPTDEENQLLQEEQGVRETVEQLGQQILETTAAFKEAENEVRWRIERETKIRNEAAETRRQEQEARQRADEEAEARRAQEREAIAAEQAARARAETEAQRHADEQTNLRLKAARLRLAAEELARRGADLETMRLEAAEAARRAEAARARDEAKARNAAELKRLGSEEEALLTATNEVAIQQANVKAAREKATKETARLKKELAAVEAAKRDEAERLRSDAEARNSQAEEQLRAQLEDLRHADELVAARRSEVEAARAKADAEAERLVEAQARMRGAEEARAQAEEERARLEVEINQQVETQLRLLEETRRRGEAELERIQADIQRQAEAEKHRLAELEVVKAKADVESKQRAEKEQQILSQIDSLRIADAETRRRIEDAEVRRRSADDAFRLVAEKVQRVEAEAHARAKEEERILAKLEAERRTVAVEAQSRAEQEKRIKEEIEMFRRLEDQERPRLEEAILQRTEAETRLQQRQDRIRAEEEARAGAEEHLGMVNEYQDISAEHKYAPVPRNESAGETVAPLMSGATAEPGRAFASALKANEKIHGFDETEAAGEFTVGAVNPAIATYLGSIDPYKRAAAVAELARSGAEDAFSQIVACFDDHSSHVRNAAARALRRLEPDRTVDLFNRALEEASPERRRNIGAAIAASGLATEAINNLASENKEDTYTALSMLFVMANTGEVEPLLQAQEDHQTDGIGKAVTKLLGLIGYTGNSKQ